MNVSSHMFADASLLPSIDNFPPLSGEKPPDVQSSSSPTASDASGRVTGDRPEKKPTADGGDDDIPLFFGSIPIGADAANVASDDANVLKDKPVSSSAPETTMSDAGNGGDDDIPVFFGSLPFEAESSTTTGEADVSVVSSESNAGEPSSPQRHPVGYAAALLKGSSSSPGSKVCSTFRTPGFWSEVYLIPL